MIAFHFGVAHAPGGLLGVDIFFVLSGFLITSLLLQEFGRSTRISLAGFWSRRIRRLLPALLLLLTVVAVVWRVTAPAEQLSKLRVDALATLGYVANWRFAYSGQGYFDRGLDPSPLLHMWSLAVEEQFYLIWPLVTWFVLSRRGPFRRGVLRLRLTALCGVVASTTWIAILHEQGVNSSRLYYGTDTHAAGLLCGAVAATFVVARGIRPPSRALQAGVGLGSVAALIAVAAAVVTTNGQSAWLYQGGFAAVAAAVALVVLAVVLVPAGPVARLLGVGPLPELGRISYGLYLWHWPVALFLTHARTGLSPLPLLALRCGTALTAAFLSWELLERPILERRFRLPGSAAMPAVALAGTTSVLAAVLVVAPLPAVPASSDAAQLSKLQGLQPASGTTLRPGSPPLRLMLEGDSIGLTLSFGLISPENPENILFRTYAKVGCGIALGSYQDAGARVPQPPECVNWPTDWQHDLDQFTPQVTAVLVGRWELYDRYHDGHLEHIGEPDFDDYLLAQLDRSITLLGAGGRKVALLTIPCFSAREQADGSVAPQNDPARAQRWNDLLRLAAARRPATARVFDITSTLCPGGVFRQTDGHGDQLRSEDGIHVTPAASELVGRAVLPGIAAWVRGSS